MKNEKSGAVAMPTDLKLKNRTNILDIFRKSGAISINTLTQMTGISRQTVVKSVNYFIEKNIIVSLGKGNSTEIGGKKPEIFEFNSTYKYLICVRFEDERVISALMDLKRNIIIKKEFPIEKNERLEKIISKFKENYNFLISDISEEDIYGVGICVSGICSQKTGIMRYNSLFPSWGQDISIVEKFSAVLPESIKVYVYNDARVTGVAELVKNPELDSMRFLTIYTNSGISASVIENSHIQEGHNSLLGEIGHICVDIKSEEICECGMNGCLEKKLSEESIKRLVMSNKDKFKDSLLFKKTDYTLNDIFEYADRGDELARRAVDYCGEYFSTGLRNIILSTDPDRIIIQGKYSAPCRYFRETINQYLSKFKYFPEASNMYDLVFDESPLWELALSGCAEILIRKLFDNKELYK